MKQLTIIFSLLLSVMFTNAQSLDALIKKTDKSRLEIIASCFIYLV